MIDSAILQLEQFRNNEEKIVKIVDNDFDEAFGRRIEFEEDEYLTVKHQEMSQLSNM